MRRNYNDPEYIDWRKKIYNRDDYRCQFPGCTSVKRLNAHHIKKWSSFPELRFVITNGITLCWSHHKLVSGHEEEYERLFIEIIQSKNKTFSDYDPLKIERLLYGTK